MFYNDLVPATIKQKDAINKLLKILNRQPIYEYIGDFTIEDAASLIDALGIEITYNTIEARKKKGAIGGQKTRQVN